MDRWNLQFVSSDVAHQKDMVHCYLAPSHGCEDAKTISEIYLSGPHICKSAIPAIAKELDNFQCYGHTQYLFNSDFEFLLLATLRLQYTGNTQMIMMSLEDGSKFVQDVKRKR